MPHVRSIGFVAAIALFACSGSSRAGSDAGAQSARNAAMADSGAAGASSHVHPVHSSDAGVHTLQDAGARDAGSDAGAALEDAGRDAGSDAGAALEDAGRDAGNDAGAALEDAGRDAGNDAGAALEDAGRDAGNDASTEPACTEQPGVDPCDVDGLRCNVVGCAACVHGACGIADGCACTAPDRNFPATQCVCTCNNGPKQCTAMATIGTCADSLQSICPN